MLRYPVLILAVLTACGRTSTTCHTRRVLLNSTPRLPKRARNDQGSRSSTIISCRGASLEEGFELVT